MYYSVLNNISYEVIFRVEQIFKTIVEFRFVELLNPKLFHAYKKNFRWKGFQLWLYIKKIYILDLDGLKCQLKLLYAAGFVKQGLSNQDVTEIIRKLDLAEVNKFLRLVLTKPATSASTEKSLFSPKQVNN